MCLERMSCYLDEVQSLALFALIDANNDGKVDWKEFSGKFLVHHPGEEILVPKHITAMTFNDDLLSLGQEKKFYH